MMDSASRRLELWIASLLRWGVGLAGLFILIGWICEIDFNNSRFADLGSYRSQRFALTLSDAVSDGDWSTLVSYAGLLVLISLPLLRVLMVSFLFIKQRDWLMSMISAVVLLGLLTSFFLGFEH